MAVQCATINTKYKIFCIFLKTSASTVPSVSTFWVCSLHRERGMDKVMERKEEEKKGWSPFSEIGNLMLNEKQPQQKN